MYATVADAVRLGADIVGYTMCVTVASTVRTDDVLCDDIPAPARRICRRRTMVGHRRSRQGHRHRVMAQRTTPR
jgi:hypothetical protein